MTLSSCSIPPLKIPTIHSTNPQTFAQISSIYAADGSLLTQVPTDMVRVPVDLSQMGTLVPEATVAIEDKRFWLRGPIDVRSILRAAVANFSAGGIAQGGSTIEEQLVKLELGTPKRTLSEKVHEILLSLGSLTGTTKSQVLDKYLNDVYLGEGTYGIYSASIRYFGVPPTSLDLPQAATLAGLINAPSAYDPLLHPQLATQRRDQVIQAMYSQGLISKSQFDQAEAASLELNPSTSLLSPKLDYFTQAVIAEAETLPQLGSDPAQRLAALEHDGLHIYTTENTIRQAEAQSAVVDGLPKNIQDISGALVSIDPSTGAVETIVGGRGFNSNAPYSQYNIAVQAQRPAGSTMKIIALAEALTQGIAPTTIFKAPATLTIPAGNGQNAWTVSNYAGEASGAMTLATATALSINTVYAQVMQRIGPTNFVAMAHAMGVRTHLYPYISLVLGDQPVSPIDMASVYATVANYGVYNPPYTISEITGPSGTVIYQHKPTPSVAISPVVAAKMIPILQSVMTEGTGVYAAINRPAAGKTGTGENWTDAWFDGFTPQLATATWVGFPSGEVPMIPPKTPIYVVGGSWPAYIFAKYMTSALSGTPIEYFKSVAQIEASTTTLPPQTTTTTTQPINTVTLNNVIGETQNDAIASLNAQGLKISTSFAPSGEYPPGYAIAESPPPGSQLLKGASVSVTIANGSLTFPNTVLVPDLLGLSPNQAASVIASLGLKGTCTASPTTTTTSTTSTTMAPPTTSTTAVSSSSSSSTSSTVSSTSTSTTLPSTPATTLPTAVSEQSPIPGTQVPVGTLVTCNY
ncbi:MAG: transglycosylase domain-containing protein [Actinomycetota bacterium]|nr:transglycosylase domain-containing protein [Actinomycetota bacterium]